MSAPGAVRRGRRAAERLMLDTCTITRASGDRTWDENAAAYTQATTTVYTGKCKVQTYEAFERTPDAGERRLTAQRYYLHLPVDAGAFQVDDTVTITAAALSPNLVGKSYVVAGLHDKTTQTAQRLLVDEVSE